MSNKKYKGVALFGGMGSGKDTFAEILASTKENSSIYNIGYICREFMKVSNVNPVWVNKSREFSQLVASKLREIDENILNDYTYAKATESNTFPIIVGGRTFEDYNYWKNKDFLLIGVNVDYDLRIKRLLDRDHEFNKDDLKHKTEKDIDYISSKMCDIIVNNNKDLNNLKIEAEKLSNMLCLN